MKIDENQRGRRRKGEEEEEEEETCRFFSTFEEKWLIILNRRLNPKYGPLTNSDSSFMHSQGIYNVFTF